MSDTSPGPGLPVPDEEDTSPDGERVRLPADIDIDGVIRALEVMIRSATTILSSTSEQLAHLSRLSRQLLDYGYARGKADGYQQAIKQQRLGEKRPCRCTTPTDTAPADGRWPYLRVPLRATLDN